MLYRISEHTRAAAKRYGVEVRPSTLRRKKIDVFRGRHKIASIGEQGYGDYGTFLKTLGKTKADKRRKAYRRRHAKEPKFKHIPGGWVRTPSYWADVLLW